jgi:hypothetical protein
MTIISRYYTIRRVCEKLYPQSQNIFQTCQPLASTFYELLALTI